MILNENILISDLLSNIDNHSSRIIFLVNDDDQLTGCVSQGDIIRSLMNGSSLKVPAKDIAQLNPVKINKNDVDNMMEYAKTIIIEKEIHALPIVDDKNKIISVITLFDVLKNNLNNN